MNNLKFEDIGEAGGETQNSKNEHEYFNFEEKDPLTIACEQFILEHNLPEDTDPASLRRRVWNAIGLIQRIKLMFKGIKP